MAAPYLPLVPLLYALGFLPLMWYDSTRNLEGKVVASRQQRTSEKDDGLSILCNRYGQKPTPRLCQVRGARDAGGCRIGLKPRLVPGRMNEGTIR